MIPAAGRLDPAVRPRPASDVRLLHLDPGSGALADRGFDELASLLGAGDLLVVNDAGTLPASLRARAGRDAVEIRLAGVVPEASGPAGPCLWNAVLFGPGSWRQRTEDRPAPPRLGVGERLRLGPGLSAQVEGVSPESARLVQIRFDRVDADVWPLLFRRGRPVQYSYLAGSLCLGQAQTPFASRPWAVEPPSASLPLSLRVLRQLRLRGVGVGWLTHAAGLSSTGDPRLDARLPLPERYEIPSSTVAALAEARAAGGRVVAVGTTVVRALEGAARAHAGALRAGHGVTDLRIGPSFRPSVVDGLLTGIHEPGSSHFELMAAFASRRLLDRAFRHAVDHGYLGHEFGDSSLVLKGLPPAGACRQEPSPRSHAPEAAVPRGLGGASPSRRT